MTNSKTLAGKVDCNQIITGLKNKVYHPVYFLTGDEPYFIDTVSDFIENNILDESEKEFNQTVLYGKDIDVLTLIGAAKRFPMMASHQVVIVKEAQNINGLVAKEDEGDKQKSKHPFQTYLENPQKSTILVLCYKYKKVDKRTAVGKMLEKHTVFFESKKLYDNQIPDWIDSYLKNKNYKIDPRASILLAEYLGTELSRIVNELDKLMINLPQGSEITADDIQKNIGISKDYNVFELQGALAKKDVLKANRIINYFAANSKEHPLVVTVGSLYNYFSKVLIYHSLADKSKNNAAAAMGVNPFFVADYERTARNYGAGKLKSVFSLLREYDLKSKGYGSASAGEGDLMKEMVFKILH